MRQRFRIASVLVALATALLVAAPVAAADQWTLVRESGVRAFAANGECTELLDGTLSCENQFIDVFKGTVRETGQPTFRGERVCYFQSTETYAPDGSFVGSHGVTGCALLAGTLKIKKLASITLAPTVIELRELDCDAIECNDSDGGTVTVSGTWTGTGPIIRQSGRFKFNDGTCQQVHADQSRSREATFVGSLEATAAGISQGSMTFKTTCPF